MTDILLALIAGLLAAQVWIEIDREAVPGQNAGISGAVVLFLSLVGGVLFFAIAWGLNIFAFHMGITL